MNVIIKQKNREQTACGVDAKGRKHARCKKLFLMLLSNVYSWYIALYNIVMNKSLSIILKWLIRAFKWLIRVYDKV